MMTVFTYHFILYMHVYMYIYIHTEDPMKTDTWQRHSNMTSKYALRL